MIKSNSKVLPVLDINNLWITANYREKQMENVTIGGLAKIKVDALGGKNLKEKLRQFQVKTGLKILRFLGGQFLKFRKSPTTYSNAHSLPKTTNHF